MLDKIQLHVSPYQTLRIWLYFAKDRTTYELVLQSKLYQYLEFVSSWRGADKMELGLISFELPLSQGEWLKDNLRRFCQDVEISI